MNDVRRTLFTPGTYLFIVPMIFLLSISGVHEHLKQWNIFLRFAYWSWIFSVVILTLLLSPSTNKFFKNTLLHFVILILTASIVAKCSGILFSAMVIGDFEFIEGSALRHILQSVVMTFLIVGMFFVYVYELEEKKDSNFFISGSDRIRFSKIVSVVSEGHYLEIHLDNSKILFVRGRISDFQVQAGKIGVLISRGVWVSKRAILLVGKENGRLVITLHNKQKYYVAHRRILAVNEELALSVVRVFETKSGAN